MSKVKKSKSVLAEEDAVVTTSSPYEKYRGADFEYITECVSKNMTSDSANEHSMRRRIDCVKLAILADTSGKQENIVELTKIFWHFVRTGD